MVKFFWNAFKVNIYNPLQAYHFFKTVNFQKSSYRKRLAQNKLGVYVPPMLIFSVTNKCNLQCKGCYHQAIRQNEESEMSSEKLQEVVNEANALGISFIIIAGGEPLVRKEIIDIAAENKEIIFFIFTNGLLIDNSMIAKFKKLKNIIPVISVEGYESDTDSRRGAGVFNRIKFTLQELKKNNVFFSLSITLTSENHNTVLTEDYIDKFRGFGGKLFFFIEYTPIKEGTEHLILSDEQRKTSMEKIRQFRKQNKSLFLAIPGDEEDMGGCLSAGRGFVHINAKGDVEPCPFAPYSDSNLNDVSLKDALQSKFLRKIRREHGSIKETEGGCALWLERNWVKNILEEVSA